MSARDLFTDASRSRFPTMAAMIPALRKLVDHGYLIPLAVPKSTGGRPASPRFRTPNTSAKAAQAAKGAP